MLKILLLGLLITSCGIKIKTDDVNVNHKHDISIDITGIIDFCEDFYSTNEEVDDCIQDLVDLIKGSINE